MENLNNDRRKQLEELLKELRNAVGKISNPLDGLVIVKGGAEVKGYLDSLSDEKREEVMSMANEAIAEIVSEVGSRGGGRAECTVEIVAKDDSFYSMTLQVTVTNAPKLATVRMDELKEISREEFEVRQKRYHGCDRIENGVPYFSDDKGVEYMKSILENRRN